MKYSCNECAATENAVAPCVLEIPECVGDMSVQFCPVTGDEIDWDRVEVIGSVTKESTSCAEESGQNNHQQPQPESVAPLKKYHDVAIIKEGEKIIAIVRGPCAHSNNWQEYYRQDVTEAVQTTVNAPCVPSNKFRILVREN